MSLAAQALGHRSIGNVAIAHQPTAIGLAEQIFNDLFGAVPDIKRHRGGANKNPQPSRLAVLLVRGLIGMEELAVQYLGNKLLPRPRRPPAQTPRCSAAAYRYSALDPTTPAGTPEPGCVTPTVPCSLRMSSSSWGPRSTRRPSVSSWRSSGTTVPMWGSSGSRRCASRTPRVHRQVRDARQGSASSDLDDRSCAVLEPANGRNPLNLRR